MWQDDLNKALQSVGENPLETGKTVTPSPYRSAFDTALASVGENRSAMQPKEQIPTTAPSRGLMGFAKDTGIDVAKGVVGFGESAVGLANIATGNLVGKGLAAIGYDPKASTKILESGYSEARKIANRNVEEAKGFMPTVQALVENPSVAVGGVVESAPGSYLGIAGVVRGVARSMLAKAGLKEGTEAATKYLAQDAVKNRLLVAGAAAEGAQSAGSIQEQGRQGNREWSDTVLPAIAAGVGTAGISFLSSKLLPDAEVQLAISNLGKAEKSTLLQSGKEIAKTFFKEGALEEMPQSAQEQVFTNLAMGKPWNEGVAEAAAQGLVVGGLQGGGMMAGTEAMSRVRAEKEEDPAIKALTRDIRTATALDQKVKEGTATEEEKAALKELTDQITGQVAVLRGPKAEEEGPAAGAAPAGPKAPTGPAAPEPEKPPASDAKKVLLGSEPEEKKETTTARSLLTEGDVDIQSEEELTPEALESIEKKTIGAPETAGTTGARPPEAARVAEAEEEEKPAKVVDITKHAREEDVELFRKWDAKEEGAPKFVRARVDKLYAEKGEAGVMAEYGRGPDNVSRYARYRLGILTGKKGEDEYAKTEGEVAGTGVEVAAGAERGGDAAAEGAGETYARGAEAGPAAETGAAAAAEEGEAQGQEKALTGGEAPEVGGYGPGHPWYYKEGGKPLPVEQIRTSKSVVDSTVKEYGKKKPEKIKEALAAAEKGLAESINRYNEVVKGGDDAISDYDKRMGHGFDMSLSLTHNHISYYKSQLEALNQLLGTAAGVPGKPVTAGTTGKTTRKPMEPAQPEKVAAKEPWQMTREELAGKVISSRDRSGKIEVIYNGAPFGSPSLNSKHKEVSEYFDAAHKEAVKAAINEGKEVPAEVLKDYPDLRKEVTEHAAKEGKQPEGGVGEHKRDDSGGALAKTGGSSGAEQREAKPDEEGKAEKGEVAEPEGWRKNIFKARKYAKALGVDIANKTLNQVVADVDAHKGAAAPKAEKPEAKPGAAAEGAPDWTFVPKEDWEKNIFKARQYAAALKVPFSQAAGLDHSLTLNELVAAIKEKEKQAPVKPEPSETSAQPQHPGKGWEVDRGAIPGEPVATYKDKVAIIERGIEGEDTSVYDLMDDGGNLIRTFGTMGEAGEAGKKHVEAAIASGEGEGKAPEEKAAPGAAGEATAGEGIDKEIESASMDEISDMIDEALGEKEEPEAAAAPETAEKAEKKTRTAGTTGKRTGAKDEKVQKSLDAVLADIAKEGVTGAEEAVKGLYELFGGAALKSFPGSINEETYAKAKPHFQASLDAFRAAGKGLKEFVKSITDQLGKAVKPYLMKFIQEIKDIATGERAKKKAEREAAKEAEKSNKFVDYGFVYDPYSLKKQLQAQMVGTHEYNVKKIFAAVDRAKIFKVIKSEAMTPGAERFITAIRDSFCAFPEALVRNELRQGKRYQRQTWLGKVVQALEYDRTTLEHISDAAARYAANVSKFANHLNQSTDAVSVSDRLVSYFYGGDVAVKFAKGELALANDYHAYDALELTEDGKAMAGWFPSNANFSWRFMRMVASSVTYGANENTETAQKKRMVRIKNESLVRTGMKEVRPGDKNVESTDEFNKPFGFKGVAFGGYVEGPERQRLANAAFDAFHDLATMIGGDPRNVSMGGQLSVQFGNLGTANTHAAGLYFPDVDTLNLAKGSGDGCLCHEWGHGLDDILGNVFGMRHEIDRLKNALQKTFKYEEAEALVRRILDPSTNTSYQRMIHKGKKGAELAKAVLLEQWNATVEAESNYYDQCKRTSNADYQKNREEMFARAFESYVYDNLGGENNYLVNEWVRENFVNPGNGYAGQIYPYGEERQRYNGYIKHFLDGLEWKDGVPSLRSDYVSILEAIQKESDEKKQALLDRIDEIYQAMFQGEASEDGLYWYRFDAMSRGIGMQPKGYFAYDDAFKEEGQDGKGAIGYPEPLRAEEVTEFGLKPVKHTGEATPTKEATDGRGTNERVGEEGVRGLEEEQAENVPGTAKKGAAEDSGPVGTREDEGAGGGLGEGGMGAGVRTGRGTADMDTAAVGEGTEGAIPGPDALAGTGNFHITPERYAFLGRRPLEDRFQDNIAALRVLKTLEREGRKPTPEEKEALFKYSGWGGLGQATSDYPSSGWKAKARILQDLLTREEINSIADSSSTAYYTPPEVIEGIYNAVQRLGFQTGSILDSATGTGNFIGVMPRDMEGRALIRGVEPETFSQRIAAYLYDSATITQGKLQDVKLPANFYDLAVTNVPFADVVPADKLNKKGLKLHDYFFIKNLHHVRPGGIVAMITTTGTMDSLDQTARKEIAKVADFVGALRLPEKMFSSTDICTDIIFLQKKQPGAPAREDSSLWMEREDMDLPRRAVPGTNSVSVNMYFANHPEMVLGDMYAGEDRWGNVRAVVDGKGRDITEAMNEAIKNLPENIYSAERIDTSAKTEDLVAAPDHVKDHAFFEKDGALFQNINAQSVPVPETMGKDADYGKKIRLMVKMVQARRVVLRAQLDGKSEEEKAAARKVLNEYYDKFFKKYGPVHDKAHDKVFVEDPDHPNVMALEIWDEEKKTAKKADIFREDVIPKYEQKTTADNAADALAITLNDRGFVDIKHMSALTGLPQESLYAELKGKIFKDPDTNAYVTREQYLAGNVVAKIETAKEYLETDPDMADNIKALEAARPPLLKAGEFSIRLGAPWIHPRHIVNYVRERMEIDSRRLAVHVTHNPLLGSWYIQPGKTDRYRSTDAEAKRLYKTARESVLATDRYGTKDKDFFELLTCALNNKRPIVERTDPDTKKRYVDIRATEAASKKLNEIHADFHLWALEDTTRATEMTDTYNHDVNNLALIECDGSHLTLPGKNVVYPAPTKDRSKGLYHTQLNAVWRYILFGNTYLAHDMGTGKTITLATIAMEAKRLGLKKKPIILTFANVVDQFRDEFQRLYPTANLLVLKLGENPLKNKELLARVATNNWDCVIMSQTSFDHIRLSPEVEAGFIQEELEEYRAEYGRVVKDEGGENKKSRKQSDIANAIARMEERMKKMLSVDEKERSKHLFFEELGIDLLLVDEAHSYKNVPFATKASNIKFINPRGSDTAQVFEFKTRYLNNTYKSPQGKMNAVVLASGTPLTNSVGELFNIQKILQPGVMRENNIHRFDAWAASFGEIGELREPKPAGTGYKISTAFRRFVNVPELKRLAYQVLDVVSSEDVGLTRPDLEGGAPVNVRVEQNEYVVAYQKIIQERVEAVEADPKNVEYRGVRDNLLRLVSDGRKIAIDQRLVSDYADTEEQPHSKVAQAADKIVEIYHKTKKERGVQLVFADLGVPKRYSKFKERTEAELEQMSEEQLSAYHLAKFEASETKWNTYDGMKEALVKRGIPAEEIAFIQDAESANPELKKKRLREIFRKTNSGKIRILMGTTKKLGTGANVQERVKAIHHMDVWWNYSSYAQRNARGWRTGNTYKNINIFNYVTEGTVDNFVWNKVFEKGRILTRLMSKDMTEREIEDLTPDQITARQAASMGDAMREREFDLMVKVDKMRGEQATFITNRHESERKLVRARENIATNTKSLKDLFNFRTGLWKIDSIKFGGSEEALAFEKDAGKIEEARAAAIKKAGKEILRQSTEPINFATLGWHEDEGRGKDRVRTFHGMPWSIGLGMPYFLQTEGEYRLPLNHIVSSPFMRGAREFATIDASVKAGKTSYKEPVVNSSVAQALGFMERQMTTRIETLQGENENLQKEIPRLEDALSKTYDDTELKENENALARIREELYTRDQKDKTKEALREEQKALAEAVNKFYIKSDDVFKEVKGKSVIVEGREQFTLFVHKDTETKRKGGGAFWYVRERSTGLLMAYGDSEEEAIKTANSKLKARTVAALERIIEERRNEENGESPWYKATRLENPQFSVRGAGRGEMPTLAAVQKIFVGQDVRQLQNGAIAVSTRGGHTVVMRNVESITPDRLSLQVGYGRAEVGEGKTITGAYYSDKTTQGFTEGVIHLNRTAADTWTLAHESMHFLEDAGILSQFDVITLKGHIKGLVKAGKFETRNQQDIGGAEDRADFLAQQLTAKEAPTGAIANIVARVRAFIDKLVNAFGKRTPGGIVRDIESGRIYERKGGASAQGAAQYEISAYSGGAADIGQSPEGRFSTKYIGTGTNSTAFGWGLYFTSKAEVANVYANLAAKMKGGPVKGGRHIHAVTLHQGKSPDQYDYIDWHGKLTERQATKLRNRIQASGYINAGSKAAQGALYGGTGGQTYESLTEMLGSKQEASRFLLKAGIDGITYRADYVMDNAPEGTRNYVVFDDNAVTMGRHVQYSVRDLFTQKQKNDPVDSSSLFPEVDARLKAAKGIKTASLKDRARDTLVEGFQHFTRHFQNLDPKKDGAIIDVLRQFQEVPTWSKEETANRLVDFVGKLSPGGRDVFTMNILLPDMLRDIDSGMLDPASEEGLPFGYKDRAQVEEDLANYQSKMTPQIEAALEKRNEFMRNLTDSLITHKLLSKELANDPGTYFHHQVLAYMNYKDNPAWGLSSTDVRTHRKGWQLSRKGSRLDYNTEYVESEFEVVSQAIAQVETVKSLKKVEELADIKSRLTQEARDQNMAEFRRWVAVNSPDEDPLKPFKVKMAMGFSKLAQMLDAGAINVPPEFEGVAEHFIEQAEAMKGARSDERDVAEVIVPHPMTFPFLSWLMNNSTEGLMPAGMIFKAIAQRNQFIKKAVGDKWATYRNLVPEGYVLHKPEASSTFYFANSLADKTVEQVISGQKALDATDIRKVLARGRDAEWVLPEGVSKTLNEFRPNKADSLPGRISKDILSTWKQWILINPFRVLKYNVNNMSGDLDICMAYDPKIVTGYLLPAFKDLWAQYKGTAPESLKGQMSALARKGLVGSGMTAMDIPELNDVGSTKALVDFMDGKSKGALMWWWSHSKKLTTLRENALRLAAYRYFKNELSAGHAVYGASRKAEIDAVQDKDDRAVKLARELIGDYGNISHAGQYIRERLIPFYSWAEINAPRYVRLFRNLKHEGGSMTGLAGTMAWKATKLGLKACALMVMVALWNGAMFPDEEEELQETGREQLHLILGRRADGSIITLRFQGALSDALSWFGMSNPIEEAKQIAKGRKSAGDVAKDVAKGAPLKLFQGLRPEPKLLYEVASGQSFYPDPTRARPIRDTGEHIARLFSLDKIYNRLAGKPLRGGDWASQLKSDVQGLLVAESDPGEQAYYTARKYVFEWLEKNGQERPVSMPTNRSNALYYYKQALRFGDFDAAAKYLNKYKELGGKETNVSAAIKRAAPLASLKLADRYKFKQSLTPEQQQTLIVAHEWYKRHYVETRTEEYTQRLSVR